MRNLKKTRKPNRNRARRNDNSGLFEFEKLEPRQLFAADLGYAGGSIDHQLQPSVAMAASTSHTNDGLNSRIQRIVNGTQTNQYPAVGIVNGGCTGTLIAPNAVLTAAHCVEDGGRQTFEVNGKTYTASRTVIHPDYRSKDVDLAVMVLTENVVGVAPYELNRVAPKVGEMLTLVGFGATGNGNTGHNGSFGIKHEGKTPIDGVTSTLITWRFDNNSESNTAPGDSGGPAFLNQGGKLVIAGVTSGGDRDDAGIGDNSYDTRVDPFVSWILASAGISNGGGGAGGGGTGGGGGTANSSTKTFTSNTKVTIPSNKVATVTSNVVSSGMAGKITDVDVKLDINHTWDSDLVITLISPSGTRIPLANAVGDDGVNFKGTILDSQAGQSINNANAPFTGRFKPQGNLSALNGQNPNGKWTLEVKDTFDEDGGRINRFAVTITTNGGNAGTSNGGGAGVGNAMFALAKQLDSQYQFSFNGSYYESVGVNATKWMYGNDGWYYIKPNGSLFQAAGGKQIGQLDSRFFVNPKLLHAAGDADLAVKLDSELGLKFNGSYYNGNSTQSPKWIYGAQGWYYIKPNGFLYQQETKALVARFDMDYYKNPALLHDASNRAASNLFRVDLGEDRHQSHSNKSLSVIDDAFAGYGDDEDHC